MWTVESDFIYVRQFILYYGEPYASDICDARDGPLKSILKIRLFYIEDSLFFLWNSIF